MEMQLPDTPTPPHVPENLVRDFPFVFGATTRQNPFTELAARIHASEPPIFYAKHAFPGGTPAWIVRRAADLREVYLDTAHFSSEEFFPFAKLIGENWAILPAQVDPPAHGPYRAMTNPLFTPKAVARLEERIRLYAREYIDAMRPRGECEFMKDFAFEFPIRIFMELMGLPHDRTAEFLAWEMDLLHQHDLGEIAAAIRNIVDYLESEIEDRRQNPRDDLITYCVKAEVQGKPLTRDELIGFTFNLFIGGLDTVSTNMGLHFWHLATHPEDQRQLREDPSLIPGAIEEMMRAYPAVTTFRTVTEPIAFKGVLFMPGDKVAMSTTLVGRDPEEHVNPDEVRFDRRSRYLSFGYGPHLCVGMHLARREMRIAMEEFLSSIPTFRLREGTEMSFHLGMIQPVQLPLVWEG